MAKLGLKLLLRSGLKTIKQSIWKEPLPQPQINFKPIHPSLQLVKTQVPIPRSNQLIDRKFINSGHGQTHCNWQALSHHLTKNAVQRLLSPLKHPARFKARNGSSYFPAYLAFGFVGLTLTDNKLEGKHASSSISNEELDDLVKNLSDKTKLHDGRPMETAFPDTIEGYSFDDKLLGKGSYGAIYPARIAQHISTDKEQSSKEQIKNDDVSSVSSDWSMTGSSVDPSSSSVQCLVTQEDPPTDQSEDSVRMLVKGHFNLAVKIIFNDRVQSNSSSIEEAFQSEKGLVGTRPHPNIVRVHQAFADKNILGQFSEAEQMFPHYIPRSMIEQGRGRNMSLYLVMDRYEMTLGEYLQMFPRQTEERARLMLCQLLEGAAHLASLKIAHRDIKDDNILVKMGPLDTPCLAITDFGCSLYGGESGLRFRSVLWQGTGPAGNKALMAPEIKAVWKNYRWSKDSVELDYRKSDGWSIGTVAYQICGLDNPFLQRGFDSLTYDDRQLPSLNGVVSPELGLVISGLLKKDPKQRLSCRQAANMIHLLLWEPEIWAVGPLNLYNFTHLRADLHRWLTQISHQDHGQKSGGDLSLRRELLNTFLARVKGCDLLRAAKKLILLKWQLWMQQYAQQFDRYAQVIT